MASGRLEFVDPVPTPKRPDVVLAAMIAATAPVLVSTPARADLRDDVARVVRLWTEEGAQVRRLGPVFLEQGRARIVDVARDAPPASAGDCITIAAIAPRTVDLSVVTGPREVGAGALLAAAQGDGDPQPHAPGDSGAVVVSRCGSAANDLGLAVLVQRSSRSAVEVVVARSRKALAPIGVILPERVAGPAAPRGTPGRSLSLGPIDARLARAESRAKSDGADHVTRTRVRPPSAGRGDVGLLLGPGCHRIEVFAEVQPAAALRFPADVDAELRVPSGQVVARDRGDASDARLDTCVGEETAAQLTYVGAPGAAGVHVTDARWPIPAALPERWGPRLRAAAFSALRRRRVPAPSGEPIHESFGVQGVTVVPIPVDPGRCYLAVAGLAQGSARGMRLVASVGVRPTIDEAGQRPEGVALTFCPDTGDVVPLSVELQSNGGWWLLGVWDMGGAADVAPTLAAPGRASGPAAGDP
jgi:hypothetical protein